MGKVDESKAKYVVADTILYHNATLNLGDAVPDDVTESEREHLWKMGFLWRVDANGRVEKFLEYGKEIELTITDLSLLADYPANEFEGYLRNVNLSSTTLANMRAILIARKKPQEMVDLINMFLEIKRTYLAKIK